MKIAEATKTNPARRCVYWQTSTTECGLTWCRLLEDSEKASYSDWAKDSIVIGFEDIERIPIFHVQAIWDVMGTEGGDYMFLGCNNRVWFVTEAQWDAILKKSNEMKAEREAIEAEAARKFQAEEARRPKRKGFCYNCHSYCYGDCGNYQPSPDYKAKETFDRNVKNANFGIED